jgi:hypothetical protein
VVTEDKPNDVPEDQSAIAEASSVDTAAKPWYRRAGALVALALAVIAAVAAVVLTNGRADQTPSVPASEAVAPAAKPPGENDTIKQYIQENGITSTRVRRGDPGVPVITMGMSPGWSGLGPDTPPWSYGKVQYDGALDPNDPPTIDVLLAKLAGGVDPVKILEYAPGELRNLPNFKPTAGPTTSRLSGFDAVQLAGTYTRDGVDRLIAQKTVVIPSGNVFYVLQINVDSLEADSEAVMLVTANIDERTVITP